MLTGRATSQVFDGTLKLEDNHGGSSDIVELTGILERGKLALYVYASRL